jgi:hypothetical protein
MTAIIGKPTLTPALIEAQSAIELPERQLLALVTIVISNVLNNLEIEVRNNNVAVQVCAVVQAITANNLANLTCEVQQK